MRDEHLPPLIDALYHSECGLLELDLTFNDLTDAGLRTLCDAICKKLNEADWHACAFELTNLYIGGNTISPEAVAEAQARMERAGRDIKIDVTPRLRYPRALVNVTQVFDGSPADTVCMILVGVIMFGGW